MTHDTAVKTQTTMTHLVDVTELPEEDKQFLVKLYALTRARQIGLQQRVVQQTSQAFQDKRKVLQQQQQQQPNQHQCTVLYCILWT